MSSTESTEPQPEAPTFAISRLNHAVLYVSDIDRAVDFYVNVLGFVVVQRVPQAHAAFLQASGSKNHHDLGLFGLGSDVRKAQGANVGLYHLAWQVPTIDELAAARLRLLDVGSLVGESSHGTSKSLYAVDPDGNEFEIMWMVPAEHWGRYKTEAVTERLDLNAELKRWSGVSTEV